MIWIIAIYLLAGVVFFAWAVCSDLPYQVVVGDVLGFILGLPAWPLIALFALIENGWLEYPLFIIGKGDDDE